MALQLLIERRYLLLGSLPVGDIDAHPDYAFRTTRADSQIIRPRESIQRISPAGTGEEIFPVFLFLARLHPFLEERIQPLSVCGSDAFHPALVVAFESARRKAEQLLQLLAPDDLAADQIPVEYAYVPRLLGQGQPPFAFPQGALGLFQFIDAF